MAKPIRTFVALRASQRVTSNAVRVIDRLAATQAEYRWVEEENLHVTLNFVGDVVDVEVPELCKIIKNAVQDFEPFSLSLQGVNAFPSTDRPRILWIGVDEGTEELKKIYSVLADVLHHWGVNKERKEYIPHMTLGRISRGGRWNEEMMALMHRLRNHDGGFCQIQEVIVYSSYQDKGGPTYTPMSRIKLQG
jgi:2'-5' RNA ligase